MTSDERYLAAAATARDAVEKSVEMWKQSAQMLSEQAVCCPSCSVAYGRGAACRDAAPAERLDARVTTGLGPPRGAPVG